MSKSNLEKIFMYLPTSLHPFIEKCLLFQQKIVVVVVFF